jgi:hypothetical protein
MFTNETLNPKKINMFKTNLKVDVVLGVGF